MTEQKLETFDKLYTRIRQASCVTRIVNCIEESLTLDLYHKTLYTFILQRYESNLKAGKPTRLSIAYLAAECAISTSAIEHKLKDFKTFGIIDYETSRSKTGVFKTSVYTKVVNLITTDLFKLHGNPIKEYWKKINDKRELIESMKHDNVDKIGWTLQECRYYWQNKNYQMITGVYLSGDMRKGLLYKNDLNFKWQDELRDFELDFLIKGDLNND